MSGEELYEKWAAIYLREEGVETDPWDELSYAEQNAWEHLAADIT